MKAPDVVRRVESSGMNAGLIARRSDNRARSFAGGLRALQQR
jgi:hypothetical protein